jgi:SAM-dependent methyltransferase
MNFQDHFSARAAAYAAARPTYPPALFAALAALAPGRLLAWDCGTGSGQAARGLAEHFAKVLATDPSEAQLARAPEHPRIEYRVALEKESGLPARSADLVTAAQAAHWFDMEAFSAEARRVLRPGGVVALWCYNLLRISSAIDDRILHFYTSTVGPFWPPDRRHVEAGYRTLDFPFPELEFPSLVMEQGLTLNELGAYMSTWSAVARFASERGFDPVGPFLEELSGDWGPAERRRRVEWPLSGRLGRLP